MLQARRADRGSPRRGAAALEFCIVGALLFLIFLGMIEVGRAMMALGGIANAARTGARTGATTAGTYSATVAAVQTTLAQAGLDSSSQVTVTVNGVVVTDDASFSAHVVPGATVSVQVRVPYSSVSWLPAGTGIFLSPQQGLSETAVFCREG
jgi:Flp pilus assembly protein TadG